MNTPNIDKLLAEATQGELRVESDHEDHSHILYIDERVTGQHEISVIFESNSRTDADSRKAAIFFNHGPALVAALKDTINAMKSAQPQVKGALVCMEIGTAIDEAELLLATLEREAGRS